ncbi:MAG: phosphatidate cytidylyltransferase [Thermodesulfobacteriota bacterium]|nr:phosphatidate cytidylyltransferase [Thermodesulfobacteriota bacterium]
MNVSKGVTRIATAFVLLPFLLALILYGSKLLFTFFILFLSVLAHIEFYTISLNKKGRFEFIVACCIGAFLTYSVGAYDLELFVGLVLFALFLYLLLALASVNKDGCSIEKVARLILGNLYVGFLMGYFILIRDFHDGKMYILFFLTALFASDTGAYYGGLLLGKKGLFPKVSPGKTVEGSFCGLFFGIVLGVGFAFFFIKYWTFSQAVLFSLTIIIFGQLGDLIESLIKRAADVKDSGWIIRGHGGILDRLDSLIFSAPVFYYLLHICA